MTLDRTARVAYLRQPSLRSTFVALVAMTAILYGFLVLNSSHAGHEGEATAVASGQEFHVGAGSAVSSVAAVAVAAIAIAAHADFGVVGCSDCLVDCAILAIACAILFILASLIVLAWLPAVYRRLLDAGGHIAHFLSGPVLDIHRPSLTALSISRI